MLFATATALYMHMYAHSKRDMHNIMGLQHLYMEAVYYGSYGNVVHKLSSRSGNSEGN